MNEAENRTEHIDPALMAAGWGEVEGSRVRREVPLAWALGQSTQTEHFSGTKPVQKLAQWKNELPTKRASR